MTSLINRQWKLVRRPVGTVKAEDFEYVEASAPAVGHDWMAAGQLKSDVDVQEGFKNIPKTLLRLFRGDNVGKQVLKIADPS